MSNPPSEYDAGPLTERVMVYRGRNCVTLTSPARLLCSAQSDYKQCCTGVAQSSTPVVTRTCVSFGSRFCKEHDGIATAAELGVFWTRTICHRGATPMLRVGKDGGFRLSKPCSMYGCDAACRHQACLLDY